MNNGKSKQLRRLVIAAVCVGMVGSGGLVQAMNPWFFGPKPPDVKPSPKPSKTRATGTITPEMIRMINVPASKIKEVPLGSNDKITKVNLPDFQIGQAEVTGALWREVYNWAMGNGYTFANTGKSEDTDHPVTNISWYDAIIWTNAYSEKSEYEPVYRGKNNIVLRDATDTQALDKVVVREKSKKGNNGYRLLQKQEWDIAARWLGTKKKPTLTRDQREILLLSNTITTIEKQAIATKGRDIRTTYYWTPGDYASGAMVNVEDKVATSLVANYDRDDLRRICRKRRYNTHVLGICDMSGNVSEWEFTSATPGSVLRRVRGGDSVRQTTARMAVGDDVFSTTPSDIFSYLGFRLARTAK